MDFDDEKKCLLAGMFLGAFLVFADRRPTWEQLEERGLVRMLETSRGRLWIWEDNNK